MRIKKPTVWRQSANFWHPEKGCKSKTKIQKMKLKFITPPTQTLSGQWAVAYGEVPTDDDLYDSQGNIKRKHIETIRFFKRKYNAEKYKACVSAEHWSEVISQKLDAENRLN